MSVSVLAETTVAAQVWRHKLGSPPGEDVLVYEETDDSFYISLYRSRSEELLVIQAGRNPHPIPI